MLPIKNMDKQCLILDDSKVNTHFLGLCLEQIGISTCLASNAKEAYNFLLANKFQVSLIDFHMPVENGADFIMRCYREGISEDLGNIYIVTAQIDYIPDPAVNEIISGVMFKPLDVEEIERVFLPSIRVP